MSYEELLTKALKDFDSFSLVWRDEFEFNEHCRKIESALKNYMVSESRTDEWPGTKIFNSLATVRLYKLNSGSVAVLERASSIGAWMAPNYPEDLAFYKDGVVAFGSIAHENEEWFASNA